jgi:hypothetical protein
MSFEFVDATEGNNTIEVSQVTEIVAVEVSRNCLREIKCLFDILALVEVSVVCVHYARILNRRKLTGKFVAEIQAVQVIVSPTTNRAKKGRPVVINDSAVNSRAVVLTRDMEKLFHP